MNVSNINYTPGSEPATRAEVELEITKSLDRIKIEGESISVLVDGKYKRLDNLRANNG
jgi:hypothetical protein